MLWKAETSLVVTQRAKRAISERVAQTKSYSAVPALLLGQDMRSKETHWEVALYDRRNVNGASFEGVLIEPDGLELILMQPNLLEVVNGMLLDWDGADFIVKQREPDTR